MLHLTVIFIIFLNILYYYKYKNLSFLEQN